MKINMRFIAKLVAEWEEGARNDSIALKSFKIQTDREMDTESDPGMGSLKVNTIFVVGIHVLKALKEQMDAQGLSEIEQQAMLDTLQSVLIPQNSDGETDDDLLRRIPSCFEPKYLN